MVKYNYTDEERFALVEVIACIKGLARVMLKYDGLLAPIVRTYIHAYVQEFIQVLINQTPLNTCYWQPHSSS